MGRFATRLGVARIPPSRIKQGGYDGCWDRLASISDLEGHGAVGEYNKSLKDVISILDPRSPSTSVKSISSDIRTRKARAVKVYKNPTTGEVIETKGGNHKGLKAWKEQYGAETVESWLR